MSATIVFLASSVDDFYLAKAVSYAKSLSGTPGTRKRKIKLIEDAIRLNDSERALRICVDELLYLKANSLHSRTRCELLNLAANL